MNNQIYIRNFEEFRSVLLMTHAHLSGYFERHGFIPLPLPPLEDEAYYTSVCDHIRVYMASEGVDVVFSLKYLDFLTVIAPIIELMKGGIRPSLGMANLVNQAINRFDAPLSPLLTEAIVAWQASQL